jgi:hypothetical protein
LWLLGLLALLLLHSVLAEAWWSEPRTGLPKDRQLPSAWVKTPILALVLACFQGAEAPLSQFSPGLAPFPQRRSTRLSLSLEAEVLELDPMEPMQSQAPAARSVPAVLDPWLPMAVAAAAVIPTEGMLRQAHQ